MRMVIVAAAVLLASDAAAQSVVVDIAPPPRMEYVAPPPLVEVSPGVQVVPDRDDEVYFVDDWYWTRHGKHWFRAQDHRSGWLLVERDVVPEALLGMPKGKYKHYKPGKQVVVVARDGEVVKYKLKKLKYKKEK